ncbi:MerR family transcriptional regulator [Streptacidiphilus jiangxiensis]|uniref:Protein phosphatase n=1 Tax=Streptacidiphilus jiangxiensis TaxID=235985 RepID=A0A1H7LYQ6_STRJI|nr:MerR family transcriptional regulator [Streptacidiphilus jiangxiensis]SEL04106.1 protein phosphatase [Streptacidiphilus jiangxiensis]
MGELLTIGAFARRAELSPKALRLYDELGLLRPVHVDPVSGYRFYAPEQLEQAQLVARLRLLGMPLARITTVCTLPPTAAAAEVAAYWAQVEHDTESRRRLARFLADHFDEKGSATMTTASFTLLHASASDSGLVRDTNQDTAHAAPGLLVVADGFGPEGARASALAVDALKALTGPPQAALAVANREIAALDESGTTLTALLWTDGEVTLAHVGDSRAYLLRDGELLRLTTDHSQVRTLIDEGRLTEEEAAAHPQRALLTRALDGREGSAVDVSTRQVQAGDRYLLCTDGLSAVVPEPQIRATLTSSADPEAAVRDLVALARRAGGPDNIAVVVADVE